MSGDKRVGNPFPSRALATAAGMGQPDVKIDMLKDDVLLEIFDSYRKLVVEPDGMWKWKKLLHVCRRWRYLILGSPRRLDLQIKCLRTTPTKKLLDTWPMPDLPIFISCVPFSGKSGSHNIFGALQQLNRISQMNFSGMTWKEMKQFAAAMEGPFPLLTHIRVSIHSPAVTAELPDSFLGGSAPHLQSFVLEGTAFSALPNLVLSATHFHQLHLHNIPHAGYIPPEAMVIFLLPFHNLKGLTIGFSSPESRPLQMSPPPSTPALLHSLTSFRFDGAGEYLVDFIARIDTPMLDKFKMTLFSDIIPNISQLHKFIDRIDRPKTFTQAKAFIRYSEVQAIFESRSDLELDITFKASNSPLVSILRLLEQFPTILSQVKQLEIYEEFSDGPGFLLDDEEEWEPELDDPGWLQIFIPLVSVKSLYVPEGLEPFFASALEKLPGERVTEVLPALENLFLQSYDLESSGLVQDAIQSFVSMRQLSGHPVVLQCWDEEMMW